MINSLEFRNQWYKVDKDKKWYSDNEQMIVYGEYQNQRRHEDRNYTNSMFKFTMIIEFLLAKKYVYL